jgi:prepilin-type processing-associated H-X9-DG protein
MSLLRILLCTGFCFARVAAAETTAPLWELGVSNAPRLLQHWDACLIAQVWHDPVAAPVREHLDREWPGLVKTCGCDPLVLLRAAHSAGLRLVAQTDASVTPFAQADLGTEAATAFASLAQLGKVVAVPGADAAVRFTTTQPPLQIQRQGGWLLFGPDGQALAPTTMPASAHDLTFRLDGQRIKPLLAHLDAPIQAVVGKLLPTVAGTVDIIPTGFATKADLSASWPWLVPLDLTPCARLPASTTEVSAIGLDGQALWTAIGEPLAATWRIQDPNVVDHPLRDLGLDLSLAELVGGLSGTWAMTTTPSAPIPGYSLFVPRTAITDRIVAALVAKSGSQLPVEGQALPIPLPNGIPLSLNLGRDRSHWVVSTDPSLAATWLTANGAAWGSSVLGQLVHDHSGTDTVALSVSDTPAQLREAANGSSLIVANISALSPAERQAIPRLLSRLATLAKPGWGMLTRQGNEFHLASEGLSGGNGTVVPVAIIAAIAIPNLLESRVTANEAAAAATLKSGVFPALVQFQAGAYIDHNHNGRGEYPPELAYLAGKTDATVTRPLALLMPAFHAPQPVHVGAYVYALHTFGDPEVSWVAYAWPASANAGRRSFAISVTGILYTRDGVSEPGTFALWGDKPVALGNEPPVAPWKPYQQRYQPPARAADAPRPTGNLRKRSSNQMRQLVLGALVFANDNDQQAPKDLAQLLEKSGGDLTAKMLVHPAKPALTNPYCYVRPASNAKATQPMLVEDPAAWDGAGANVAFCDGHVAWLEAVPANRVWKLAQQLAKAPETATKGLTATDWAPVKTDLEPPAKRAPESIDPTKPGDEKLNF